MGFIEPVLALGVVSMLLAQAFAEPPTSQEPTCDKLYAGPPGGDMMNALNWQPTGLPTASDTICFPPETANMRIPGSAAPVATAMKIPPNTNPPPPTTLGACCLGSTCLEMDFFDCREQRGWFLEGITFCAANPCNVGACCTGAATGSTTCTDQDPLGRAMDEGLCNSQLGTYVGGAACGEADPCERARIPDGFEIIDVACGNFRHRAVSINDCGQIVYHINPFFDPSSEIMLYDNGLISPVTDNTTQDAFPNINASGIISWTTNWDGLSGSQGDMLLLDQGSITVLGRGLGNPPLNNFNHVVWSRRIPGFCPSRDALDVYDGRETTVFFDDGLANQNQLINNIDDIAWTRFDFISCEFNFNWTSDIMLYDGQTIRTLPSVFNQCAVPGMNDLGNIAWDCDLGSEIFINGETLIYSLGLNTADNFDLNNVGDIAFMRKSLFTPWQLFLDRDGVVRRISKDSDIANVIDNIISDSNDHRELAWKWDPNGNVVPAGIRYMRRIRNGDVDFDGDVDINDFIPMPGCYTGLEKRDGLCGCRFFDIDNDRDVDEDDFALLMRNYAGPLNDCNTNGILDLEEMLDGRAADCNLNATIDACEITINPLLDSDTDGVIDACCADTPPQSPASALTAVATNRYLAITVPAAGDPPGTPGSFKFQNAPGPSVALRVTFVDLPGSFAALNGTSMWVGPPEEISENGGLIAPDPNFATFNAATLQCDPFFADWSALGDVHVSHADIIPGGRYDIQTVRTGCGLSTTANFSLPLSVTGSVFGDVAGRFDPASRTWTAPDGIVEVISDAIAVLDKFAGKVTAPIKARADLDPQTPNRIIDIADVVTTLGAFRGRAYSFAPDLTPCP